MRINLPFEATLEGNMQVMLHRELESVIYKFVQHGWTRVAHQEQPTAIYNKKLNLMLILNHKILTYIEVQKKSTPWVELSLVSKTDLTDAMLMRFRAELSIVGLEPFVDAENIFKPVEKVSNLSTTVCYVNPDYVKGYKQTGIFKGIRDFKKEINKISH